jgi:serine/threonine protein kinase
MGQPATIEHFGKYQILERVAQGGMAEIFKARMEGIGGFNRLFAIKRVLPGLSNNREYIDLLVDEAKVAGLLSHANIVQILDLGQVKGQYYVAMEYVHGRDLGRVQARAKERGITLPVPHSVFILIEVLKGLEYAHNRQILRGNTPVPLNIVHRDISPSNVLLSFQGEVKLTDFGIAKASVKALETVSGVIKGKFDYMSPEQASAKEVDQRTDLFAAGVLLYEMLCGAHPYRAGGDLKTIAAIRAGEYQPPTFVNPDVPYSLEVILDRALAHDPDERFQTATEFKDALARFFHDAGFIFSHSTLAAYLKGLFPEGAASRKKAPRGVPLKDQETRPIPIPAQRQPAPAMLSPEPEPIDEGPPTELVEVDQTESAPPLDLGMDSDEPIPSILEEALPTTPEGDPLAESPSVAFGPVDTGEHTFDAAGDTSALSGRDLRAGLHPDSLLEDLSLDSGEFRALPGDDEATLVRDPLTMSQAAAPPNEWAEDVATVIRPDPTKRGGDLSELLATEDLEMIELDDPTAEFAAAPPPPVAPAPGRGPAPVIVYPPAPPERSPEPAAPRPSQGMTRRTQILLLLVGFTGLVVGFSAGVALTVTAFAVRNGGNSTVSVPAPGETP